MRRVILSLFLSILAWGQIAPIRLDPINLIPPAINADGRVILFGGTAVAPYGAAETGTNLYSFIQAGDTFSLRRLTNFSGDSPFTGVTSVTYAAGFGAYAALPAGTGVLEEVHLIDTVTGADRTIATDKEGCIQILCVNCFRACVGPVHLTPDARKVLYSVARERGFYTVNADGTGLTRLPIYIGALAASPQSVISRAGEVVFTSSAPSGPTFAPAATDVHIVNLDGTGLRQVTRLGDPRLYAADATLSADGRLIAFAEGNQIWAVRADGTGLRRLSTGPDAAEKPSISADGSVVVFLQAGQIKQAKTSDGTVLTLTSLSVSSPRDPVVSDDGAFVVFTLGPPSGSPAAVYRIPTNITTGMRGFLSVYSPRLVNAGGVTGAAGYGAPTPGSLIGVYGVNLALDDLAEARAFPLPVSLQGLSLLVNGSAVPLLAATPWQINAQLPQSIPAGIATFQVTHSVGIQLPPVNVDVKNSSPAVFVVPFGRAGLSYTQAAAVHAGTGIVADMDHPAAAGETLEIYGIGLGVTDPQAEAGVPSPSSPPARALFTPRVQIGGRDAAVTFAGLTPGLAGVYQVNAIVPAGLAPGLRTVTWSGPDGVVTYSSIAVK